MNPRLLAKLTVFIVIAGIAAAMEFGTLTGPHVGATHTYHAIFGGNDGVSGLRSGQAVEVSGVPVGKVTGVKLIDAAHANVTFTANGDNQVTSNTWAVVRYANLLGQRYLALTQSGATPGTPLPAGSTIPQQRTAPALSLTALFNGFKPLFAALTPQQVNDLSGEIIDVLQGQSASIDDLIAKTADLTSNLADRDATFDQIVDSLSQLLTTVSAHDNDLAAVVTTLNSLTTSLHADGPAIVGSLASVDNLTGSLGDLLGQLENHNLPADIVDAASVTKVLASNTGTLNSLIGGFVQAFGDFARTSQNGNWLNIYACNVTLTTTGTVSVTGKDAVKALKDAFGPTLGSLLSTLGLGSITLAALAFPTPLKLPNGAVGHSSAHTAVCR
jgi:virulence factor Mce-like protein